MDTKHKNIIVRGFVLKEEPIKEYDKRLTILTKELGKIIVYSFGSRRPKSKNLNTTSIYAYTTFTIIENKGFYNLKEAEVKKYFKKITEDYDDVILSQYMLELMDFVSYENIISEDKVRLLYNAFLTIEDRKMERRLIKAIYEYKLLSTEGLIGENVVIPKKKTDFILFVEKLIKDNWNFRSKILRKI